MKLTRAGFLALLTGGMVGAQERHTMKVRPSVVVMNALENTVCTTVLAPLMAGQEYCPVGHPQKPKYIRTKAEEILAEPGEETVSYHIPGNMEGLGGGSIMETYGINVSEDYVNQRICSTCGITYFNPKDIQP